MLHCRKITLGRVNVVASPPRLRRAPARRRTHVREQAAMAGEGKASGNAIRELRARWRRCQARTTGYRSGGSRVIAGASAAGYGRFGVARASAATLLHAWLGRGARRRLPSGPRPGLTTAASCGRFVTRLCAFALPLRGLGAVAATACARAAPDRRAVSPLIRFVGA